MWVIFGPLVASADCAKKRKAIERIRSREMTARWKEAMVPADSSRFRGNAQGYIVRKPPVAVRWWREC